MEAPLYKFGLFGDNASLLVAFAIGLGFGFFLERAGFGSGLKLAREFYFRDMAVLKVMFTAIVTAMLGTYWLSRLGVLDLSKVYLVPTHLGPQVVGGLVLGLGFVIGGYCPGTSVVSAATGRIDGIVYMAGMFVGMLGMGFVMPHLAGFMASGNYGQATLSALWNVPYGVLVALVVLMAIGAFFAAEWAEVKTGSQPRATQPLLGVKGLSRSRQLIVAFAVIGLIAAVAGNPYEGFQPKVKTEDLGKLVATGAPQLSPVDLAERLILQRDVPRIVDLRAPAAFARYHVPGAENVPLAEVMKHDWPRADPVLLYADSSANAEEGWLLLKARKVAHAYTLTGGLDGWNEQVLFPKVGEGSVETAQVQARRAEVARHFGGTPRGGTDGVGAAPLPMPMPAAPPAPSGDAAPKKKPKKEGC